MRGGALAAAWLCGWLAWQKMHGSLTSLPACGGVEGCQQVLGGRWSEWLGVPVSFLAFGFYLTVLLLTLRPVQRWLALQADRLLCAAGVMAILCAAWFIGLLAVAEREFCPYCALAHGLGMVFGFPLLFKAWKLRKEEGRGFFADAFSTALPGFLILVLGQVFGPRPVTHEVAAMQLEAPAIPATAKLALRPGEVAFFGGAVIYPTLELPIMGDPAAVHLLVKYFDYTCPGCRHLHEDLAALLAAPQCPYAVVLLPCPLNHACNPHLSAEAGDHPFACELAQDALAVWRKNPAQFRAFHDEAMTRSYPGDFPAVHQRAVELCGGLDSMKQALADPWIAERMAKTFEEYRLLSWRDPRMPKLLLRENRVLTGAPADAEALRESLRQEFGK